MGQAAAVSHFVVVVCLLTKQYYFHIYRWFASTWPGTLLLDNKVTKHGAEQEGTFWQCYVTFVHGVLLIMGFNAKSNSWPSDLPKVYGNSSVSQHMLFRWIEYFSLGKEGTSNNHMAGQPVTVIDEQNFLMSNWRNSTYFNMQSKYKMWSSTWNYRKIIHEHFCKRRSVQDGYPICWLKNRRNKEQQVHWNCSVSGLMEPNNWVT